MTKLSQQLNQQSVATSEDLNGFINNSPIYVTSLTATESSNNNPTGSRKGDESPPQTLDVRSLGDRRSSSPFQNGRTELLIGEDNNKLKTTAVVENNNNKLNIENEQRSRRRSGSSIVVLDSELQDPIKKPLDDLLDGNSIDMVTMVPPGSDGPPHREMAVDVPDSFVARNKTPPRYPPPKPTITPSVNGSATPLHNHLTPAQATPQVPPKPVPPPRDHLKIEADGRLVNKAPAPQLPARIANNNNNINALSYSANSTGNKTSVVMEPTREQLDSIKKYQEQIRKRKEEEERIAAQNEFLHRSLRGSLKLQALESKPQGAINDAYEDEASETRSEAPVEEKERVHLAYAYGDLVAAVQRLQLQLKKTSAGSGISGLEGRIAAIQSLLLSPQFGRALAIHNKIQAVRSKTAARPQPIAQNALRDAQDALGSSQSAYAVELATLLTGYEFEALMVAHDGVASTLPPDSTSPPPQVELGPSPIPNSRYSNEDNIKIIRIEKTTEPLGATVRNEGDAVVIGRVVRGGAAEKSGLLHEGDEILEVNGIEMRGKSVNAVCDILKDMEGSLTILIIPASQSRTHMSRDMVLHVRALFDYDPEDDMYIPCRELGISFRKGDVLHVISQEDTNWWQAYREGEEDQTLAGLIPSLSFQHQRESVRLATEERMTKPSKKSSTLLCGTTSKKKKKKGAYDEGGYPMYSNDDYDTEEILTYEEVSLYYPRADKKRPIVLIGPPDIGRHELRKRLMENSERFAAAIPHTSRPRKESEVDGQDYHFISRGQFEADILSRKFVEHGEYEKAYYGTSLDAIRSVVISGKICVLNLHPQSLKILRTSDLKPYVVFVAPPNLENLKIKKDRLGESYKEEDLVDIIDKAREMENKYGHFFDMIIINNDTERAYHDLLCEINSLEREPQWVPAVWVKST
ncbi:MAGUK p55 family member stardust isoform X8 [Rhynchophorus ferrugineus]